MSNIKSRVKALESKSGVKDASWTQIIVRLHQTTEQALDNWMAENNATQEPENIIYRIIVTTPLHK